MKQTIYIILDEYNTDGARILCACSSYEKAKEMQSYYKGEDNEYGEAIETEIVTKTVL